MEQNAYEKVLTLMSAKEVADPILMNIQGNINEAVNMLENDQDYGASAAIGRAQLAMNQFMALWKVIAK